MGETEAVEFDMDGQQATQGDLDAAATGQQPAGPAQNSPESVTESGDSVPSVPEQFLGPEGVVDTAKLLQSWQESQRKITELSQAQSGSPEGGGQNQEGGPLAISRQEPENQQPEGQVDWQKYSQEYYASGELSAASRAELEKVMPAGMIDQYMQGVEAVREQSEQRIMQVAGGAEQWNSVKAWARGNLSEAQLEAFNAGATSGNPQLVEMAVRGLMQMYSSSPAAAAFVDGDTAPAQVEQGYKDPAEMTAAMRDPKYESSEAYRAEVERKVALMRDGSGLRARVL